MKGILKIYHPEETLKYQIKSTYCKAVYLNAHHFLEVEMMTDDSLDHVEDDSLQNLFPQLTLSLFDFPISSPELEGHVFTLDDHAEEAYTEVDLHHDEEAFLTENELSFSTNDEGVLQLVWKGKIDDFYSHSGETIPFKLKCHFKEEAIEIED